MSQLAENIRDQRRQRATAGSSHDRLIRVLQVGLPALLGALMAVLVFSPFSHRGEIGFLLAKDRIEIAQQRMRVEQARYRGNDSAGRPFVLSADGAVQRSAADPVVRMVGLVATIVLNDGQATLLADAGRYDPTSEAVDIDGPLRFTAQDGYRLDTADVTVRLKDRQLSSGRPVSGSLPIGRFSANRLTADLETRIVRLDGAARLRINQGVLR